MLNYSDIEKQVDNMKRIARVSGLMQASRIAKEATDNAGTAAEILMAIEIQIDQLTKFLPMPE